MQSIENVNQSKLSPEQEKAPANRPHKHPRHVSRELALQVLYGHAVGNTEYRENLASLADSMIITSEQITYAVQLVQKTLSVISSSDEKIAQTIKNWDIMRLTIIDKAVLRLAIAELRFFKEIPYRVVLDEAVELAKSYGTDDSGKFVNGVLDAIYKQGVS